MLAEPTDTAGVVAIDRLWSHVTFPLRSDDVLALARAIGLLGGRGKTHTSGILDG